MLESITFEFLYVNMNKAISEIASNSLYEELITYPKPGLVSKIDNGSHLDMNYELFLKSINSLEPYFLEFANIGSQSNHDFADLRKIGIAAEKSMLLATNNINTHRGSIFILGILIAATAYCLKNNLPFSAVQQHLITRYQIDLKNHRINPNSHGAKIRKLYKLESIINSATNGFPIVFNNLQIFQNLQNKHIYNDSKICLFLHIMQSLDDTNIVHRGGLNSLAYAKNMAQNILTNDNIQVIKDLTLELHLKFKTKHLSPGGVADILSAVIFMDNVRKLWR